MKAPRPSRQRHNEADGKSQKLSRAVSSRTPSKLLVRFRLRHSQAMRMHEPRLGKEEFDSRV